MGNVKKEYKIERVFLGKQSDQSAIEKIVKNHLYSLNEHIPNEVNTY